MGRDGLGFQQAPGEFYYNGYSYILISRLFQQSLCCKGEGHLFVLAARLAYTQNNHTETVFIKTLPGP